MMLYLNKKPFSNKEWFFIFHYPEVFRILGIRACDVSARKLLVCGGTSEVISCPLEVWVRDSSKKDRIGIRI